jgi:hypothetical protein
MYSINCLSPCSWVRFKKEVICLATPEIFHTFIESQGSLLHSQEPTTGRYPESDEFYPRAPFNFSSIYLNVTFSKLSRFF